MRPLARQEAPKSPKYRVRHRDFFSSLSGGGLVIHDKIWAIVWRLNFGDYR